MRGVMEVLLIEQGGLTSLRWNSSYTGWKIQRSDEGLVLEFVETHDNLSLLNVIMRGGKGKVGRKVTVV